jgi:hypothetical protein
MVWDQGIIISFNWLQLDVPIGVMALLEDKKSLGREDLSCPHFWIPLFGSGNDFPWLVSEEKGSQKGLFNVT